MLRSVVTVAVAFAFGAALPASAHEFSTSYSHTRVMGAEVHVALTLSLIDMHEGPVLDLDGDGLITSEEMARSQDVLLAALRENFQIRAPDPPLAAAISGYTFIAPNVATIDLLYEFGNDVRHMTVASRLDRLTQPNHQHLFQIGEGDDARHVVLNADSPEFDLDYATGIPSWVTMRAFLLLGVEHIFTGYDHLAFLAALLLTTTTLLSLIKVVTAFTVAHSVTLALATLGIVVAPERFIESLIALSIAYVAVENYLGRSFVHRWKVTFGFGLIHGFGFANILTEMSLSPSRLAVSLFSFNLGVEVGQVAFVALLFPLLYYMGRYRWKHDVTAISSLLIMGLGFYWFVQRAFFM